MIEEDALRELLQKDNLTKKDMTLIILAVDSEISKPLSTIKDMAISAGFPAARKWNISQYLSSAKGLAISLDGGWILTKQGKKYLIDNKLIEVKPLRIQNIHNDLRKHISNIVNPQTRLFLEEAISCLELELFRAAVVFSWVGAIAILHEEVSKKYLKEFNAEATRRNNRWKPAKNTDDLSRMNEGEFLTILEVISVIGKNVKQELENSLRLRNSCGHPNSLHIAQNKAVAHVEILILNVFSKFV